MIARINSRLEGIAENSKDWTWTLFRVISAAMFMTHGFGKLFGENPQPFMGGGVTSINIGELISIPIPMDINALFLTGVVELFGGLLILIGLWTPVVTLIAAFFMIMAYLTSHLAWFPTLNRGELAAMYVVSYLVLFAFGPGPYSVDAWISLKRQQKPQGTEPANS
jgi:putative oxidoreductase